MKEIHVGFTGAQEGMTLRQRDNLRVHLERLVVTHNVVIFHLETASGLMTRHVQSPGGWAVASIDTLLIIL